MLNAHVESMILLATPFKASTPQPFTFGPGTNWANITAKIREYIPIMLRHRLTPPPRETYSLNRCVTPPATVLWIYLNFYHSCRKLSGAFLLASRLGAVLDTKALWENVVDGYRFDSR